MKKAITVLLCLLFALTILFPVGSLVCACFGYKFELISIFAFSAIIAVISVLMAIFSIISKEKINNKGSLFLLHILTPLSLINAVLYIFESGQISVVVCMLISVACSFLLTIRNIMSKVSKIVVSVLFAISTASVIFFAFIMLMFGNIGQNTVVQTVESPSGKYYAQVVDSDQGALGGGTIVDVYEKREIDVFVFKLIDKPQRVYLGEWREFENMQIQWKDDNYLVVNSVEYEIK